jgi:tetratricopeptide (TPR) repeat protein
MTNGPENPQAPGAGAGLGSARLGVTSLGGTGNADELVQRAGLALNSQRPGEAEAIARDVLRSHPQHARALHVLGYALLMQGRAEDAIAALEPASRSRRDPEIETQLAIALRRAGRHDDALSRLKRATKRLPPYAPAFRELGSLLAALEHYDEAIEALRRGLDVAPLMSDLSIQLGYIFLARRDCSNARTTFARALEISSGSFEALYGMAKAHQEIGESQIAADYFRRCLMIRPNDANTWLNLGHCHMELGRRDAGYECFRTAARGDAKRYGIALTSLAASSRGRFWLKPSAAARSFRESKS